MNERVFEYSPESSNTFADILIRLCNSRFDDDIAGVKSGDKIADPEGAFRWLLNWPPDVFLLTSRILRNTGTYIHIVSPPNPDDNCISPTVDGTKNGWHEEVKDLALQWKICLICPTKSSFETDLIKRFKNLYNVGITELYNCKGDDDKRPRWLLCKELIRLHAIADETCRGIGILSGDGDLGSDEEVWREFPNLNKLYIRSSHKVMQLQANLLLTIKGSLSRLPKHQGIIAPKARTPQYGTTLRSLSFNLTYHVNETDLIWRTMPWNNTEEQSVNIMIVPWPWNIYANDFKTVYHPKNRTQSGEERHFRYSSHAQKFEERDKFNELLKLIVQRIREAIKTEIRRIHLIIFPEGSLSYKQLKILQKILSDHENEFPTPIIIAGVTGEHYEKIPDTSNSYCEADENKIKFRLLFQQFKDNSQAPYNNVIFCANYANHWYEIIQGKHHRWFLNNQQIRQYELAGILTGGNLWWEYINVRRRSISFISMAPWLTMCPLICEDLARLEPVSEIIRGVGPNLLLAILLDGPQLRERWPGRYASVFADDPGSSVLTTTAIGMVKRSKRVKQFFPQGTDNKNYCVGLWKDQNSGFAEIEATDEYKMPILKLNSFWEDEMTGDGRKDYNNSSIFTLSGNDLGDEEKNKFDNIKQKNDSCVEENELLQKIEKITSDVYKDNSHLKYSLNPISRWQLSLDFYELSMYNYFIDAILELYLIAISSNGTADYFTKYLTLCLDIASLFPKITDPNLDEQYIGYNCSIYRTVKNNVILRDHIPIGLPSIQYLYTLQRSITLFQEYFRQFKEGYDEAVEEKERKDKSAYKFLFKRINNSYNARRDGIAQYYQLENDALDPKLDFERARERMEKISSNINQDISNGFENFISKSGETSKYSQGYKRYPVGSSDEGNDEFKIYSFYTNYLKSKKNSTQSGFTENMERLEDGFQIAVCSAMHNRLAIKRKNGILTQIDAEIFQKMEDFLKKFEYRKFDKNQDIA